MQLPAPLLESARQIQVVALDLDGTTLTTDKHITPRTREALVAVGQTGRKVVFATGRMLGSAAHYAEQVGLHDPHVALNGSLVGKAPETAPLFDGAIPPEQVSASLERLPEGVALYWLTRGAVVTERSLPNRWSYLETWNGGVNEREVGSLRDEVREPVYQLHCVGPEEVLRQLALEFEDPRLQAMVFASSRGPLFHLEIRVSQVDKATGLQRLCDHLGAPFGATLAVGDWLNDLEMLEQAGVGVARANANPALKQRANYVLERTNDEEAVAELLERLFL